MRHRGSAAVVLACWCAHAVHHVARGTPLDLLWACNVAVPILALGLLLGAPLPSAVALLWLSFGTPVWLVDLASGAGLVVTSPLVHVVAPVAGVIGMRRLEWPRRAWLAASLASVVLLAVSRLVGEPGPNVNLAFRIHPGWERLFGTHPRQLAALLLASTLVFFFVDHAVRRLLERAKRGARTG